MLFEPGAEHIGYPLNHVPYPMALLAALPENLFSIAPMTWTYSMERDGGCHSPRRAGPCHRMGALRMARLRNVSSSETWSAQSPNMCRKTT
ncbi:hypothetical protein GCM10009628_17210 [Paeniglutamicibacter kerguelensis]